MTDIRDELQPVRHRTINSLTVQLTEACNLKCAYCFAQDEPEKAAAFISDDDYAFFLDFSLKNGMRGVRLTGGETMLHPHAKDYINKAAKTGLPVHVFTNFTLKDSLAGLEVQPAQLSFLVNINDLDTYKGNEWENVNENLKLAAERGYRLTLGYNIYALPFEIGHITKLAARYGLGRIRISPAKPIIGGNNVWLQNENMGNFAFAVYKLHTELRPLGIRLVLDCPLPFCHLPEESLPFFMNELRLVGHCSFGVSIDTKLGVGHCYITNSLIEKRNLRSFRDKQELVDYLNDTIRNIDAQCPRFSICTGCRFALQGACRGGCYGTRHVVAHRDQ